MKNPVKVLVKRWAREEAIAEIEEQTQAKQDACGHWVSGTYREGVLCCDACGIVLSVEDAEVGAEVNPDDNIAQRYIKKVL